MNQDFLSVQRSNQCTSHPTLFSLIFFQIFNVNSIYFLFQESDWNVIIGRSLESSSVICCQFYVFFENRGPYVLLNERHNSYHNQQISIASSFASMSRFFVITLSSLLPHLSSSWNFFLDVEGIQISLVLVPFLRLRPWVASLSKSIDLCFNKLRNCFDTTGH